MQRLNTAAASDNNGHGRLKSGGIRVAGGADSDWDGTQLMSGVTENTAVCEEKIQLSILQTLKELIQGKLFGLKTNSREEASQRQHGWGKGNHVEGRAEGILDADADNLLIRSRYRTTSDQPYECGRTPNE